MNQNSQQINSNNILRDRRSFRFSAFTVMELLVVMGVSSLIITAAYFILSSFTGFFDLSSKNLESTHDLLSFNNTLQNDVFKAGKITDEQNQLVFSFADHEVVYRSEGNMLIRNFEGVEDTLWEEGLIMSLKANESSYVEEIEFRFTRDKESYLWTFDKEYGPVAAINNGN